MKKIFKVSIILLIFVLLIGSTIVKATDVDMNLSSNSPTDDTVYGSNSNSESNTENTFSNIPSPISVNQSDNLNSSDMNLATIINIILVALGVLLILLGIAILIRMR